MKADVPPARPALPTKRQRQTTQRHAAAMLPGFKQRLKSGDGHALFWAISVCDAARIAPPRWITKALTERWTKFYILKAASLGEAFGVPPHTHLDSKRRDLDFGTKVWFCVDRVRAETKPAPKMNDPKFWDAIGRHFTMPDGEVMTGATAKKLFYQVQKKAGLMLRWTNARSGKLGSFSRTET